MIGRLRQISAPAVTAAIAAGLLVAFAGGCGSSGRGRSSSATAAAPTSAPSRAPIHGNYSPSIDPADFVARIDNHYFPLEPGTAFHYRGVMEDGKTPQTDDMVVTRRTKEILGVKCTVVRDTVRSRGRLIERTFDWYAQDRAGNVWYMGEDAREVRRGRLVRVSDSWEAGVKGAKAGIIMPGNPRPGDQYRQEYYPRYALDQARVLGSGGPVSVLAGSFGRTLLTEETSPLDPARERKYYVAGVGDVKERTVAGNREQIQLVSITR
jgi:hypothetical protein